jgi:hypothetical protein
VYRVVEAVGVGVRRWWCCSEASPRFSAHGIGPSSRVYEALCRNGERWCRAPGVPPFIWRCARGAHWRKNDRHPRSRREWRSFHKQEIIFLTDGSVGADVDGPCPCALWRETKLNFLATLGYFQRAPHCCPHAETTCCWATVARPAASACGCASVGTAAGSVDPAVFSLPSLILARLHLCRCVARGGRNDSGRRCPVARRRCPTVGRRTPRRSSTDGGEDEGEELDEAAVMSSTDSRDELDESGMEELRDEDHNRED